MHFYHSNSSNNKNMFNNYYYNPYYNNYPRNHHFYPNYSNNYNSYSYSPYYNYYYNQGYYPRSNESNNRYYLGQNGIEERKLNDYNYDRYNNRFNRHYNNNKEEEKTSNKKSENDLILDYENNIRKEIEKTTPLISDELSINKLMEEYKSNEEYLKSIENISKKYKTYKKVRRDGNCFYRSFIYRLFEQTCIKNDKIRHNSDIIASTIIEMICNDLKFHDMQNNTEYLLLQSVLKDQKKLREKESKKRKREKILPSRSISNSTKKPSKFKEKYSDRVRTIQNTENKIAENRRIANEIEKMEKTKMELQNKEESEERTGRISYQKDPFRRSHGKRNK